MKLSQLSFLSLKEYDKKIAIVISFIFVCLFFMQIAALFRPFEPNLQQTGIKEQALAQETITLKSPIFTFSLFGDYLPINLSDEEIKQSMLDVEVVGIMYSVQEGNSQVLIRAAGGEEQTYVVGDSLPGGAVIKRIGKDGVVVLHNGTLESLSLPKIELRFEKPAKPLIEE